MAEAALNNDAMMAQWELLKDNYREAMKSGNTARIAASKMDLDNFWDGTGLPEPHHAATPTPPMPGDVSTPELGGPSTGLQRAQAIADRLDEMGRGRQDFASNIFDLLGGIPQKIAPLSVDIGKFPIAAISPEFAAPLFEDDPEGAAREAAKPAPDVAPDTPDTPVTEGMLPSAKTKAELSFGGQPSAEMDSFGIMKRGGDEDAVARAIRDLTGGARTQGGDVGSTGVANDPTVKPKAVKPGDDPNTPLDESKFAGGARAKVLKMFGHHDEDSAQRFGQSLMAFGSGLLTGGPDFGAAMGKGFEKALDQYVSTGVEQRDKVLDEMKIREADLRLEKAKFDADERRRKAARDRAREASGIVTLDEERDRYKKGYVRGEDGKWSYDPSRDLSISKDGGVPDEVMELERAEDYYVSQGYSREEARRMAREALGVGMFGG